MNEANRDGQLVTRRELITAIGGSLLSMGGCLDRIGPEGTATAREPTESESPTSSGFSRTGLGPDTFERLVDLEVNDGEHRASERRCVTMTQCVELHTGADGAWFHIPLDEPMDFRNARLACHMAADGTAAGTLPYLDFRDVHGNRFRMRTVIRSHGRPVRVDFGVTNPQVDGMPVDLGNIDRITFRLAPTGESGTETVYIDWPTRVAAPDTPKVVFMFDDGNVTDYTKGLPYLSQYDYPAITYVNTETVGNEGQLDEDQLYQLSEENWLIGSHTTDHTNLKELDERTALERKVGDAKQWLIDRGFEEGARHFAYPYNRIDEQALKVVSEFHDTGRVHSWQPIALPSNPQLIPGAGEPGVSKARRLLDWAVQFGGVISFYYHDLASGESLASFREVVDEVCKRERAGEVDVIRLDDLEAMAREAVPEY